MCLPLKAQIYADFKTSLGDFTAQLDYTNSPRTVANFITLAEGTRNWLNSSNGVVKINKPYYNGISFHRVIAGFMNQAGSQNGQGTDGPGYTFPDEVANGLTFSSPYQLAMANSGPNTNGSQFFITVGTPTHLNGIHTIFGNITSGTNAVDVINGVATNNSTNKPNVPVIINSVTIRRVGAQANAFNEFAQILPSVKGVKVAIAFPSNTASLVYNQPTRSSLNVYSSEDMTSWTKLTGRYLGNANTTLSIFDTKISAPRQFFFTSITTWPDDAIAPNTYYGKKLTALTNAGTIVLDLNPEGASPIGTLTLNNGNSSNITELRHELTQGYGSQILIITTNIVPIRFTIGYDNPNSGRLTGTAFTSPTSTPLNGTFTITP